MPEHKTIKPYRSAAPVEGAEVVFVSVTAATVIGLGKCTE